ncbi:Protein nrde2 [Tyrophagus putrescentiae]|nr:Protein nrde2 [Tyrophagus putrescentiae]
MSLFPAYSSTSESAEKEPENASTGSLFPSTDTKPTNVPENVPPSVPSTSYQSYQPDILEVWNEKRKKPLEILISSEESESDSDDSVQIIDSSRSTKDKDKEKKRRKKDKKESKKKRKKKDDHRETRRRDKVTFVRPGEKYNFEEEYISVPDDWNQLPEQSSTDSLRFQSFQAEPMSGAGHGSANQRYHELTTVFNRLVTDQPNQIQFWIDFIRFQDLLLAGSSRKFASEKKHSIAERALELNRRSVPLHLVKLKLLSAFYPELVAKVSDVDAEWKRVCFLFPNVPELWFDYSRFTFRCASVLAFKASSRTRKVMTTAFKNLSGKVLEGDFVSHQVDASNLEKRLVDLAAMVSRFLKSIDQSEKATAIWQALVEFNLYTPTDLRIEGGTFEDWFILFEQFWDSSLSRIGEFSPITWSQFRALTVSGNVSTLQAPKDARNIELFNQDQLIDETETQGTKSDDSEKEEDPKSQIWLHYERLRQSLYWLPATAGAPTGVSLEDIEDLERVVLSDEDVKPWLFRLRLDESKWYMVTGFLEYLGVPLVTFALDSAGSTSRFEVEVTSEPETEFLFQSTTSNSKLFECSLSYTRGRRFESPSEVVVIQKFGLHSLLNPQIGDLGLVLRVEDDISRVDTTATALKDAVVCNVMTKVVEYAKRWPTKWLRDLVLIWIRYKLVRYQAGLEKVKLVRKFIKVLNHFLYHTISAVDTCQACRRRSTKSDDGSVQKSKTTALRFLVSVINGDASGLMDSAKVTTPTEIVRAMKRLENDQETVEFLHTKVLLVYLSKGVSETVTLLSPYCHNSPKASSRSHQLLQVQLLLHAYSFSMSSPPTQPTVTRSYITSACLVIKSALHSAPSDPLFLSLLISLEIQFNHLWFRLRRDLGGSPTAQFEAYLVKQYLEDASHPSNRFEGSQESNWNRFMAALHSELLILDRFTQSKDLELSAFDVNSGIINRIRHLFERALHYRDAANEDSSTVNADGTSVTPHLDDDWLYGKSLADCPTIWRLFLRFELKTSQSSSSKNSGAAKAIIYRALQHCPNAKTLYLDAINFFPELYQEMVDIMTDKQLRVRTTVEEIDMFVEAKRG